MGKKAKDISWIGRLVKYGKKSKDIAKKIKDIRWIGRLVKYGKRSKAG